MNGAAYRDLETDVTGGWISLPIIYETLRKLDGELDACTRCETRRESAAKYDQLGAHGPRNLNTLGIFETSATCRVDVSWGRWRMVKNER